MQPRSPRSPRTGLERHRQAVDLILEEFGGTFIPEDKIGQLDFSRQWQLLGDSQSGE
jgi:hypothetical protein